MVRKLLLPTILVVLGLLGLRHYRSQSGKIESLKDQLIEIIDDGSSSHSFGEKRGSFEWSWDISARCSEEHIEDVTELILACLRSEDAGGGDIERSVSGRSSKITGSYCSFRVELEVVDGFVCVKIID